jgi:hypothetical protein
MSELDAEWYRCRTEAKNLMTVELVLSSLAVGVLVIVALCGIVTISHDALASGDVALPLGLALAVSVALVLLGLAARTRMSHERSRRDLFRLECARRIAAERAMQGASFHPYRMASATAPACTFCVFVDEVKK